MLILVTDVTVSFEVHRSLIQKSKLFCQMGYGLLASKVDMKMRLEVADITPNTADSPTFQTRVILKAQLYSWAEMCVLKASLAKVSCVCCGEKGFPKARLSGLSPRAAWMLQAFC